MNSPSTDRAAHFTVQGLYRDHKPSLSGAPVSQPSGDCFARDAPYLRSLKHMVIRIHTHICTGAASLHLV